VNVGKRPVVTLRGRLGNNLFQFAIARSLANGHPAVLYGRPSRVDRLEGAVVNSSFTVVGAREMGRLRRIRAPNWVHSEALASVVDTAENRLAGAGLKGLLMSRTYVEGGSPVGSRPAGIQPFDEIALRQRAPVLLDGFFQSERYFRTIHAQLLQDLRTPSLSVNLSESGSAERIAVVIRAGADFEDLGWTIPISWYRTSLERAVSGLGHVRALVFSDIPAVAELFVATISDICDASPVLGMSPLDQLWTIGHCDHAIVGPSTFGWWGAWLGDAIRDFATRTVIAPDPWVRPGLDVVPDRWVRAATAPEAMDPHP